MGHYTRWVVCHVRKGHSPLREVGRAYLAVFVMYSKNACGSGALNYARVNGWRCIRQSAQWPAIKRPHCELLLIITASTLSWPAYPRQAHEEKSQRRLDLQSPDERCRGACSWRNQCIHYHAESQDKQHDTCSLAEPDDGTLVQCFPFPSKPTGLRTYNLQQDDQADSHSQTWFRLTVGSSYTKCPQPERH
jgi:hypothetical protein